MLHLKNNISLIQNKINVLIWLRSDLDKCLEYIYELVLSMLLCYEDDINEGLLYDYDYTSTECNLEDMILDDISWISSFTNLNKLLLSHSDIADISFITSLTNLIYIDLNCAYVSDIIILSLLNKIKIIGLSGVNITDVSCLSLLINLTELYLNNTNITNIYILEHLKPKLTICI